MIAIIMIICFVGDTLYCPIGFEFYYVITKIPSKLTKFMLITATVEFMYLYVNSLKES